VRGRRAAAQVRRIAGRARAWSIGDAYVVTGRDDEPHIARPDHRTPPIPWHPSFGEGEVFDLLRLTLEAPSGTEAVQAWLYIPHGSPHRKNLQYHELLLSSQISLAADERCTIHVRREAIKLPYMPGAIFAA